MPDDPMIAERTVETPVRRRRSLIGRLFRTLLLLAVLGGLGYGLWWIVSGATPTSGAGGGPPGRRFAGNVATPVVAAAAELGDLPVILTGLGTVTPLATVTVRPQVGGPLVAVLFKEGQMVEKGAVLAEIDPRPFQLALDQATAQLQKDQAQLRNAELDLERYRTLVRQDSIARQQRDTQEALVQQSQGVVRADQVQVEVAKLNLSYTRITAPIAGRTGLRLVDAGNMVQANDATGIAVITELTPISVLFTLPEDQVPPVLARLRGGASLPVTAFDRGQRKALATGTLATVDNQVDPTTGTVKLRAVFENTDQALFANQFVNVRLLVDTVQGATVIPSAAVQRGLPGTFVYRVDPPAAEADATPPGTNRGSGGDPRGGSPGGGAAERTVSVRPVTLGVSEGDRVAVTEGLAPGDQVVVDGADRLRAGAKVVLSRPPAERGAPRSGDRANRPGADGTGAGGPRPGPQPDGSAPQRGLHRPDRPERPGQPERADRRASP